QRPRLRELKVLFFSSLRACLSGDDRDAIRVAFKKGADLIQRLLFEFGGIGTGEEVLAIKGERLYRGARGKFGDRVLGQFRRIVITSFLDESPQEKIVIESI